MTKEEKESAENKENDEVDVPSWLEIWDSGPVNILLLQPVHGRAYSGINQKTLSAQITQT